MQPDLLWNVGGIPPEAREAARAAARREGMPVGEWLTRRILRPPGVAQPNILALPESWRPNPAANADGGSGGGAETRDSAPLQQREQATALPSEMPRDRHEPRHHNLSTGGGPSTESPRTAHALSQSDPNDSDLVKALASLQNEVLELVERHRKLQPGSTNQSIKDAVTALHAGLSKLNEQTGQATRQTDARINGLSQRVDSLSSRIELTNCEMEITALQVKDELAGLGRRVDQLEKLNLGDATAGLRNSIRELGTKIIEAESIRAGQLARLKKALLGLGTHMARSNVDQKIAQLDKRMSELSRSGDRAQVAQKLSDELSRLARRLDSAETIFREDLARLHEKLNPAKSLTAIPDPPKEKHPEFNLSALTQALHQSEAEPYLLAALPSTSTPPTLPSARPNVAFGDFGPIVRPTPTKKERRARAHRGTSISEPTGSSDKIRLRNVAITSVTVLLFALAAAYFLYHNRALASQLRSQPYVASTAMQNTQRAATAGT